MKKYSLMIHGGAGAIADTEKYRESIARILKSGGGELEAGKNALDVVEHCTVLLEDDPLFNAGHGSVLNEDSIVETDAAIMDGRNLDAGSVAAIKGVKNPIQLARTVMEKSEHVMLIGDGAQVFAKQNDFNFEENEYFLTEARIEQLEEARTKDKIVLDHSETDEKYGTVGAVAFDQHGNLAAATSTGGLVNKKYGRVGDSPIVGSGVFADNDTCAISTTGIGEHFLRTTLAKHASGLIAHDGLDAKDAAQQSIDYMVKKINGLGGMIVIDKDGNIGSAHSTELMLHGSIREGEDAQLLF